MNLNKLEVFMAEGTYDGIVSAKYDEFPGRMIKVHNYHINENVEIKGEVGEEIKRLKRPGIYFICGKKPNGEDAVYIGESEDVFNRLTEHSKDFEGKRKSVNWTTAYAYTREGLEIEKRLFLEFHFCQLLKKSKQYKCINQKVEEPDLDYYDKNNMLIAMEKIQDLLKVVGGNVLEEICTVKTEYITLYCEDKSGARACGYFQDDESFVVLEESKVSEIVQDTMSDYYRNMRKKLEEDGTIVEGKFVRNYAFNKITPATYVVCGREVSGKEVWKTNKGVSIKDAEKFIVKK